MVARARCRALLTDATDVSSSSATSSACQCRTSRRISTARCFGGSFCSVARKARRIVSRAAATSAGSPSSGTTRLSGMGSIQAPSGSVPSFAVATVETASRSIGRARRWRPFSIDRQTLVAMRCSHERRAARPSKRSYARQARTNVSCTASSASKPEPSIR